jgi:hypothetical protein
MSSLKLLERSPRDKATAAFAIGELVDLLSNWRGRRSLSDGLTQQGSAILPVNLGRVRSVGLTY